MKTAANTDGNKLAWPWPKEERLATEEAETKLRFLNTPFKTARISGSKNVYNG